MNRKKYEKRTHILQVRMTEKEVEVAEHCAKRKKMTLSRYVRWCLFHKKTEISYNEDVFTEEMKEIIRQNTGAAVNLNQIARSDRKDAEHNRKRNLGSHRQNPGRCVIHAGVQP